jgi:hypothetical protein
MLCDDQSWTAPFRLLSDVSGQLSLHAVVPSDCTVLTAMASHLGHLCANHPDLTCHPSFVPQPELSAYLDSVYLTLLDPESIPPLVCAYVAVRGRDPCWRIEESSGSSRACPASARLWALASSRNPLCRSSFRSDDGVLWKAIKGLSNMPREKDPGE